VVGSFQYHAVGTCGHLEWVQPSLQEPPHSEKADGSEDEGTVGPKAGKWHFVSLCIEVQ
jgi:hypothetical protein